jgi:hypothetical protein
MATLPTATVSVSAEAGSLAGGTGYCVVFGCVATAADATPRVHGSWRSVYDQHGYSPALDYVALHIQATRKPVIFVGIPVVTAGFFGQNDSSGVTGTSQITTSGTPLEDVDAIVTVTTGGTIGTAGIVLSVSMDGGRTETSVKLGTASTYVVPYLGITLNFGAGTLVAEDEYTFKSTSPMWDSAGVTSVRTSLAAQLKLARSWMAIGDITSAVIAGYVVTAINAYETSNARFTLARANIKDRLPLATKSKIKKSMVGTPSVTFAEVGATGDTITRATGSFVTDGFAVNDLITVAGTASNNFTDALVTAVTATVLTLDTQDLVAETTSAATIIGSERIVFAEVGASGDTITRSTGSWVSDGFAVGDIVTVSGTASNNVTTDAITGLSATVMTLGSTDLTAETIAGHRVGVVKVLSMSAYVAAEDTRYASIDAQKRIDMSIGRLRVLSPVTGWEFPRPTSWAASIREYQKDIHVTNWRVKDGPLDGWSMLDEDGNLAQFDERIDGGGLAARFTCATTHGNGPNGSFIARSLTRDTEGAVLSQTHNMYVANLVCTVVQAATTLFLGQTPPLNDDGTMRADARSRLESAVNTDLEGALLKEFVPGEGARCSSVVWTMSADDNLSGAGGTVNGVAALAVNGTIVNVNTVVRVS